MTPDDQNKFTDNAYDADDNTYAADAGYDIDDSADYEDENEGVYEETDSAGGNDQRSFFQRYSSIIIYGAVVAVMAGAGYFTFKDKLFPQNPQAAMMPAAAEPAQMADQSQVQPPATDNASNDMQNTAPPASAVPNAFDGQQANENSSPFAGNNTESPLSPAPSNPMQAPGTAQNAPVAATPPAVVPAPVMPPVTQSDVSTTNLAGNNAGTVVEPSATSSSAPVVVAPDNTAQATDLKTQNDVLTQKNTEQARTIANLQEQLTLAQSALANAQETAQKPVVQNDTAQPDDVKPEPKKTVKKAAPVMSEKATTSKAAQQSNSHYRLLSVSNNAAWIAPSGSNELRRVQVGDNVDGIGQVTSIKEQNGSWVVQGSKGRIQ